MHKSERKSQCSLPFLRFNVLNDSHRRQKVYAGIGYAEFTATKDSNGRIASGNEISIIFSC